MAHFRYVSDNPYRLLGVGSALRPDELRRRVETVPSAAAGLRQVFGDEDLPRLAHLVRGLERDPKRRTICRCFWPLHYQCPPDASPGIDDFERCFPVRDAQSVFLPNWFAFLATSDPERLRSALAGFRELHEDRAYTAHLAGLLQSEGESETEAAGLAEEARSAALSHLLTSACRRAAELWEEGEIGSCVALLEVLCAGPFGEPVDAALRAEIVPVGDREMARLRRAINATRSGSPEAEPPDGSERRLGALAGAVKNRVPTAALWLKTVDERARQTGAENGDQGARSAPADGTGWNRIETVGGDDRIWKNIRRVHTPPMVFSVLGTGTRMRGRKPFGGQSAWYYSTLYFCILFVPLVPLAHYVVSYTPFSGYYFHGRVPLTRAHKYHIVTLFSALSVILLLIGMNPPEPSAAEAPPSPSASGAPPLPSLPVDEKAAALPDPVEPKTEEPAEGSAKAFTKALRPRSRPASSTPSRSDPDPGSGSGEPAVVTRAEDPKRERLAAQWQSLDQQNEAELLELELEKARLEAGDRELQATFAQLKAERTQLDPSDKRAVLDFNRRLNELNTAAKRAERRWSEHNRRVDAYNRSVERLNAIAQALRRMGE